MLSKVGSVALILAITASCATGGNGESGADSPGSPLTKSVSKNQSFVMPLDDAQINGGYLLRVSLKVPSGQIGRVEFSCEGKDVCAHVFACPATDRCGPNHQAGVTYDGDEATWWGWTDAGMADDAFLKFKIHFTGAEPPPPPPC
jgi:hypothetical protein